MIFSMSPEHRRRKPAPGVRRICDGRGRPSMKTGLSVDRSHLGVPRGGLRETGSTSFQMRSCDGPREMYIAPCGRHCHSGSV